MSNTPLPEITTRINESANASDLANTAEPPLETSRSDTQSSKPVTKWFRLQQGFTYFHLFSFLLASLFTISFFVYINSSQVFILKDILHVPDNIIGYTSGSLVFYDQIGTLVVITFWGVLSDSFGRRPIYVIGYTLIGITFILYPLTQNVYPQLLLLRLLFCIGGAAVSTMISAVLADIADERDRGKIAGISGLFTGLGALIGLFVFLRIPVMIGHTGNGLRNSYWIIAAISIVLAVVLGFTLPSPKLVREIMKKQLQQEGDLTTLPARSANPTPSTSASTCSVNTHENSLAESSTPLPNTLQKISNASLMGHFTAIYSLTRDGLRTVVRDPRLILGLIGSFLARGDTITVTLFIPLWVYKHHVMSGECEGNSPDTLEVSCPKAYIVSSILTGVIQTFALVGAPIFGFITDIVYPPLLMLISTVLAMAGYLLLFLSTSPGSKLNYFTAFLIGFGEIGLIIVSLTLVTSAKSMPIHLRGSISGISSFCGASGILIVSKVGGLLFDSWTPGAPFLVISLMHILCVASSVTVICLEYKKVWGVSRITTSNTASA
ncbi:hypothetical protein QVD99_001953 [Batrachochytrium dendrobatidis]|nr:hypothetical protein O5D80_000597 [Batrachochytrium dendrobatidis]KAK5672147.1 hypothetical protein QVD99_001953 [Batrachochytrium dendrobatidis]